MKRILSVLFVVLLVLSLTGCGDTTTKTEVVNISYVKDQIATDLQITDAMEVDSSRLLDLYGIAEEDIAESACFVTMDGVFPDEIVMVRATDASAADRVEDCLNTRLDEVKVQSQSYDPENYAMAQECTVIRDGVVVALFLSPDHAAMEEIFASGPRVALETTE